ncbi:hypothetical protein PRZ48_013845 [Zasmidium cellare]|uniref:Arb2 domain-containing protein n=1 Tax=Zasmidium cellare TaxID=395010 RepID=A0ABR0E256_ZASCE|nr:hypothetical protein PRZ48_013845 [Zasmidium cellare]
MFKLTKPPPMENYALELGELGFQLHDDGQIRSIHTDKHFDYFFTEDEVTNDRRKEAVHDAVRRLVAEELAKYDIVPVNVAGKEVGVQGKSVTLLATQLGKLSMKKDVIVVVGEAGGGGSGQDAGVWAYRSLMREGGLQKGSAVGLAEMLRKMGKEGGVEEAGMVILNPGQLLYSHEENKAMSQTTWMARAKKTSLSAGYEVDEKYNQVEMHTTAKEHIRTVLGHILPKLLDDKARVHMLCVGESVKDTIDYLDELFTTNPDDEGLTAKLQSIVLIAPNHNHEEIQSSKLKYLLRKRGIAFVESETKPIGTLVAVPTDSKKKISVGDGSWIKVRQPSDSDTDSTIFDDDDRRDSTLDSDDPPPQTSTYTYSAGNLDHVTELIVPECLNHILGYIARHMSTGEDISDEMANMSLGEKKVYPDIMKPIIQAAREQYEEEGKNGDEETIGVMLDMESLQQSPEKDGAEEKQ